MTLGESPHISELIKSYEATETELLIGNGKAIWLESLQGKQSKFPTLTYPNWPLEIRGHKRLNETWLKREFQRLVSELEEVDPTIWGDWVD